MEEKVIIRKFYFWEYCGVGRDTWYKNAGDFGILCKEVEEWWNREIISRRDGFGNSTLTGNEWKECCEMAYFLMFGGDLISSIYVLNKETERYGKRWFNLVTECLLFLDYQIRYIFENCLEWCLQIGHEELDKIFGTTDGGGYKLLVDVSKTWKINKLYLTVRRIEESIKRRYPRLTKRYDPSSANIIISNSSANILEIECDGDNDLASKRFKMSDEDKVATKMLNDKRRDDNNKQFNEKGDSKISRTKMKNFIEDIVPSGILEEQIVEKFPNLSPNHDRCLISMGNAFGLRGMENEVTKLESYVESIPYMSDGDAGEKLYKKILDFDHNLIMKIIPGRTLGEVKERLRRIRDNGDVYHLKATLDLLNRHADLATYGFGTTVVEISAVDQGGYTFGPDRKTVCIVNQIEGPIRRNFDVIKKKTKISKKKRVQRRLKRNELMIENKISGDKTTSCEELKIPVSDHRLRGDTENWRNTKIQNPDVPTIVAGISTENALDWANDRPMELFCCQKNDKELLTILEEAVRDLTYQLANDIRAKFLMLITYDILGVRSCKIIHSSSFEYGELFGERCYRYLGSFNMIGVG